MKLLIIAGPYEADRIRRAAVSAGFETVAVEPGESLSGWISATRPDLIVMAPQIVNPDPNVALAKVRATPRGRVPIFLVGDQADEARLDGLADGFFVRPIAPADLIEQARARVLPAGDRSGPVSDDSAQASASGSATASSSAAGVSAGSSPIPGSVASTPSPGSEPKSLPALGLRPLVAQGEPSAAVGAAPPFDGGHGVAAGEPPESHRARDLLEAFAETIDASLDADMNEAALELASAAPPPPAEAVPPPEPANEQLEELRDESSQKTVEVPNAVVAKMMNDGLTSTEGRQLPPAVTAELEGMPAPSERGPFGTPDLAALLGRIFVERLTGWLTFRRGSIEKAVVLERGAPILAGSNLADDRLGEMLIREGRLSREQQRAAEQSLITTGRRFGAVLIELGLIKAAELAPLVRRHHQELIFSLFAWPEGGPGAEWTLGPDRPDKDENIRLIEPAPALIFEGIRRKYGAERLLRCLGGGAQVLRLRGSAAASPTLDKMALTEEERALVPRFDGVRTLEEIAALAGLPIETVLGLAWALVVVRVAATTRSATGQAGAATGGNPRDGAELGRDRARGRWPGPAQERAQNRDQERARERAIDRGRILARYALSQEGDYFELLGVSREASPHEVLRAHQALARELSVQASDTELVAALGAELRAIRTVIDEGGRVLSDPRLRRRYQAHLPAAPGRRPG